MNGPRAWTRVTCFIVVLALVLVSAPQLLIRNVSAAPIVSNATTLGFYETAEGGVYSDAHMNQRLGTSETDVEGIAQLNVAASISGIDYDYGLPGTEDDVKIAKVQVIASANTRESIEYLPDNQPYYDAVLQPYGTEIDFGYEDGVWRSVPDFWYYGAWYDMLYISTQGFVVLGRSIDPDLTEKTPVDHLPQDLSSPDCPKPLIAPFWRELAHPDSYSGVYISFSSKSFGSSHYVMTITWDNVRDWLPSHQTYWRSTFALNIWYSPWDVPFIEFEYESLSPVPFDTTIGLVDQSGKHVVSLPYDWETLDGKEIRFWNYYLDNFWTVLGMRVGARKYINGQPSSNDGYSWIDIGGIGELEPGGINACTDWVPGEYMDPNIDGAAIALGVASLAVGIAGVATGGAGILALAGIAVDGASLLYEMGQIDPNEAVLNEAGKLDQEAYIYSHAYDPCNPTMFPDCASDVSLFPVFEYNIPIENGFDRGLQIVVQVDLWNPVTFESRNAEIVTSPLTFSLTGNDWLENNIDYRVHGLNWLGRTIPDQRTHTFKPVQDSWGYAPTSHFICSVDSKTHPSNEYGYDIMGWSKLTDDFGNDYKVRPDGTIRVDGYFRLSDTFSIGDARRNVNVYGVYSDEGNFDDIAAETSITSLANQGNYVWKYCSATLSGLRTYIPGESYRQPVKIGVGREVYGPTDYQQVAQWSSDLTIYSGNDMVLGVEVTTPGGHTVSPDCYYGQTAKQVVQYSDSHAVVGVSDNGYMLDHWVFEGVTVAPGASKSIGGTTVTASGLDSSGDGSLTISNMYHDYDLEACFALAYSLTITAGTGGTTNPAPGTYYYASGSPVTVTAIPDTGYEFDHWVRNGVTYTANPMSFAISSNTNLAAYFEGVSVPTITVTRPNGGETWRVGDSQVIQWTSANNPGSYVKIELYRGSNTLPELVIRYSEPNDGAYQWSIPTSLPLASDYRVKISSTSTSASDYSDSYFALVSSSLIELYIVNMDDDCGVMVPDTGRYYYPAGTVLTLYAFAFDGYKIDTWGINDGTGWYYVKTTKVTITLNADHLAYVSWKVASGGGGGGGGPPNPKDKSVAPMVSFEPIDAEIIRQWLLASVDWEYQLDDISKDTDVAELARLD